MRREETALTALNETKWLIAREIPRLRRYALTLAESPEAADDLVQDTLERAIRKRHLWQGRGSMRSWLYRILFNVFANQKTGRRRRREEMDIEDAPATPIAPTQEQTLACRNWIPRLLGTASGLQERL